MDPVAVAAWSFTACADIATNAHAISAGLEAAHRAGARIMLTPECALCGYPGAARDDLAHLDWSALARAEAALAARAREHGMLLILGSVERARGHDHNVALACGAVVEVRYRKQCLIPRERAVFAPGASSTLVEFAGWRWGLAICFDVRFGEVWTGLAAAGADGFLAIAHMAGADPDPGTKLEVVPALCAARAAETATPLVLCNTSAADRYCPSLCYDARGVRIASSEEGLMLASPIHRSHLDPWYQGLHDQAIARWRGASSA